MLFNFDLSQEIERFLLKHSPCREYDIICHLQANKRFQHDVLRNPLSMFRCHFMIFNALYRLQLKSHIHQQYSLDISSLLIELKPYVGPQSESDYSSDKDNPKTQQHSHINTHNALSHFYLDYSQVMQTTESDVNTLLDQFWKQYLNPQQKTHALSVLGLSEPVDFSSIKKQYRRLAMKHHPDRGGDGDKLIAVHQAMQCLEMYY